MRSIALFAVGLLSLPSLAPAAAHLPSRPARAFAPGEVVVVLAPGALASPAADGRAHARSTALAGALASLGLDRARDLRAATPPAHRRVDVFLLASGQPGFDPVAAASLLRALPGVVGATPNLNLRLDRVPNDPALASQWHLSNSAAAVHARQGWDRDTGSPAVPIAIIDTGVDTGHEDMLGQVWTNPGEVAGNGIDDDFDGHVDDVHGWDFGDDDADARPTPMFDPDFGIDEGWHGTFVAGLAAAATDNGVGIAGMAWHCSIMPLKISNAAGELPLAALAGAVDYAVAHHASVINFSLGSADTSAASFFQPLINEAITADIVCVASAGNDGTDAPQWPAACDSVLAVASTNDANQRSDWSNWGVYVDMCAPGESMWSCIGDNYVYDENSQFFFELLWGWDTVNPYMLGDGTSFAAPVVSGAAALVRSHAPWMHALQVTSDLVASGDVKVYDNPIGPKLNLDRALQNVLAVESAPNAPGTPALAASPNPARTSATLRFALPRSGGVRLAILDPAGRRVRTLADGPLGAGGHALAWDLRDERGTAVAPGLYFARLDGADGHATRRVVVLNP